MKFLEKDLEQIVWETDNNVLTKQGLIINGRKKRQLNLGGYGIADLVTFYRPPTSFPSLEINVFELKKEVIDVGTFLQALNYCKGIEHYLRYRGQLLDFHLHFSITLIGSSIKTGSPFVYMPEFFKNLKIYTYHYSIDGLIFNLEEGWQFNNTGFKGCRDIKLPF